MSDKFDELEGFKADTAPDGSILVNGEVVKKPKGGFKKSDKSAEDLNLDPEALAGIALEKKMFKLRKKLGEDLVQELEQLTEDELDARIVRSECAIHESEQARDADEDLHALKEQLKDASAPYRELKQLQTAIAQYSACLIDKRGGI